MAIILADTHYSSQRGMAFSQVIKYDHYPAKGLLKSLPNNLVHLFCVPSLIYDVTLGRRPQLFGIFKIIFDWWCNVLTKNLIHYESIIAFFQMMSSVIATVVINSQLWPHTSSEEQQQSLQLYGHFLYVAPRQIQSTFKIPNFINVST